jgi:hypothetical protein
MASATTYLRSALANHVLDNTAYTSPTTVYLALFTADLDADGATTDEVSGGSYAREALAFTEGDPGEMSNASLSFTDMPATTVRALGIMDAASGGNMLYYANFSPVSVGASETYPVNAGTLVVKHL